MTMLVDIAVACAACGTNTAQKALEATPSAGSPDLDLRPSDDKRATMAFWVQECPACGYVSPRLDQIDDAVRAAMAHPGFAEAAAKPGEPTLIGRFRKGAWLAEATGQVETAAVLALWTAWVADDAGDVETAQQARSRAADLFAAAPSPLSDEAAEGRVARLVDILRRAGRFSEAEQLAAGAMQGALSDAVMKILTFQRVKTAAEDMAVYRVEDALTAA